MKELTKAEENVMLIIWSQGKTTVKKVLEVFPDPKPSVNTVSTVVRILEQKGYLGHERVGRGYFYYPVIEQGDYKRRYMHGVMSKFFEGSFKNMISYFAKHDQLKPEEIDELMKEVQNDLKNEGKL